MVILPAHGVSTVMVGTCLSVKTSVSTEKDPEKSDASTDRAVKKGDFSTEVRLQKVPRLLS